MKRLTIFGMTSRCLAVLGALCAEHPGLVDAVVSARDRTLDDDSYEDIRDLCLANEIVFRAKDDACSVMTDYAMAIAWRWLIVPGSSRLIVLHDSLLPRYRGFFPLVTALLNGDEEIGVTALYGAEEYDRGEIIAQSVSRIAYPIKIKDAIDVVTDNYVDLALHLAAAMVGEMEIQSAPQDDHDASYSLWRDEEDFFIDWSASADHIKRFVDALGSPYRGAAAIVGGDLVRVLEATVEDDVVVVNRTPGKVIFVRASKPIVVCGRGLLRIDALVDDQGNSRLPLASMRLRFKGLYERGL